MTKAEKFSEYEARIFKALREEIAPYYNNDLAEQIEIKYGEMDIYKEFLEWLGKVSSDEEEYADDSNRLMMGVAYKLMNENKITNFVNKDGNFEYMLSSKLLGINVDPIAEKMILNMHTS